MLDREKEILKLSADFAVVLEAADTIGDEEFSQQLSGHGLDLLNAAGGSYALTNLAEPLAHTLGRALLQPSKALAGENIPEQTQGVLKALEMRAQAYGGMHA